jgi:hypothetical protein
MNCISPPELSEQQLLEYLDGEADAQTIQHLERCEFCRRKSDAFKRLQGSLTARLYRLICPSPLELGEYHLRILSAPQMLLIAQHVRECPHCQREVAQLETYLSDLGPHTWQSLSGTIRVIIARLVDAAEDGSPLLVPLRGQQKGPITLEADGIVITLDLQPTLDERLSILGQVAADDQDQWTGAMVELRQADAPQLTASLDDLGAFRFEAVRAGVSRFTITSTDGVTIETLDLDLTV